jgi:hypothetical protein
MVLHFCAAELSSCDIECGDNRFVVENECLIDILDHKLIRSFSKSSDITIPSSIEILEPSCFALCISRSSVSFEPPARLARVESRAFAGLELVLSAWKRAEQQGGQLRSRADGVRFEKDAQF